MIAANLNDEKQQGHLCNLPSKWKPDYAMRISPLTNEFHDTQTLTLVVNAIISSDLSCLANICRFILNEADHFILDIAQCVSTFQAVL